MFVGVKQKISLILLTLDKENNMYLRIVAPHNLFL